MGTKVIRSVYDQIKSKILMTGPIPVAEYMKMALTQSSVQVPVDKSPGTAKREMTEAGYYMKKDVFGPKGDFITSPEISQMFGEMIGIWGIQTWLQIGGPKKFNIVELGPGRGSLAKDVLRVFKRFEYLVGTDVALHLVEISPYMANLQEETLCAKKKNYLDYLKGRKDGSWIDPAMELPAGQNYYHKGIAKESGYPVYWYRDVYNLPKDFNFYMAHEFFDALPIHKLQKGQDFQWREVLIDIEPSLSKSLFVESEKSNNNVGDSAKLRYVISRGETPAIKVLKCYHEKILRDTRNHLEISLETISIVEELSRRIEENGGIGLIVDYGHDGTKEDTFRGFHKHQLHDPLVQPGMADLTADVDFSIIRMLIADKSWICGPTNQSEFLKSIGIDVRFQKLLSCCTTEEQKSVLTSGYKMLIDDMGERFKFMGIFPKILENYSPALKIVGFNT